MRATRSVAQPGLRTRLKAIAVTAVLSLAFTSQAAAAVPTPLTISAASTAVQTLTGGKAGLAAGRIAMHTTPNDQGDNAILNMFQWTWNSIAAECTNVIGPAGFAYVQVSPPQEHIIGVLGAQGAPWWTSYQPVSYKVESKLGTRAEFATMVQTCRDAGSSRTRSSTT
jgi:alpha-amylase